MIALPDIGQRLAISSKSNREPQEVKVKDCELAKKWTPKNCRPVSELHRQKIMDLADPAKHPNLKYNSPPSNKNETDCSHFVNDIFDKAGIEFPYTPTGGIACLKTFEEISSDNGKPGDLVLYDTHVGILAEDDEVISATFGGAGRKQSIQKYPKKTFGEGKIFRWKCP